MRKLSSRERREALVLSYFYTPKQNYNYDFFWHLKTAAYYRKKREMDKVEGQIELARNVRFKSGKTLPG